MPIHVFQCKKCKLNFELLRGLKEQSKPRCPKCNKLKDVSQNVTVAGILGPTSSKLENFEYRAGHNLERAQNESRTAKEEAAKRGISGGYNQMDDISSGMNFDPAEW